jgi:hypothetical protein
VGVVSGACGYVFVCGEGAVGVCSCGVWLCRWCRVGVVRWRRRRSRLFETVSVVALLFHCSRVAVVGGCGVCPR